MIKLIIGKEGSGKTRTLIQEANESIKRTKGNIVFLDVDNNHMFQIDYKIRFMGIKEYKIINDEGFYGFICGIIASNYDVEGLYIDGLTTISGKRLEELKDFFAKIDLLEIKYNINFVFTVNGTKDELPDFLRKYNLQELE